MQQHSYSEAKPACFFHQMDHLDHSSPAVVTRTQLLVFHPTDLGWPAVVARQRHRAAAHAEHPFLRHLDEAWGDLLARHVAAIRGQRGATPETQTLRFCVCCSCMFSRLSGLYLWLLFCIFVSIV